MLRNSARRCRGYYDPEPIGGFDHRYTAKKVGGQPRVQAVYTSLTFGQPQRPLRATEPATKLPPVLYSRQDQLMELHNALLVQRRDNQMRNAMNQLQLGVRNADHYIKDVMFKQKQNLRPNMHDLVFAPGGLNERQHVLSGLRSDHLVPIFSHISTDYEEGKIDLQQAEAVVHALADSTVGHSKIVQRELYNQYVRCCALAATPEATEKAFKTVREMKNKNIRRTYVTYAPLFRLARQNGDEDLHLAVTDLVADCEGGMVQKIIWIDTMRMLSVSLVFVRFFWAQIACGLIAFAGLVFGWFLLWSGIG